MKKLMKAVAALMLTVTLFFTTGCNKENNYSDVRVTTYTPQDITQTTAKCGGDVIVEQGLSLSELGVCWSTERNPSVNDAHLSTVVWNEPYVCTITGLEPNTRYHVRAYVLRGLEYYYGEDKTFTTESNGEGGGTWNGHDYVDLGLPSGILWATCNVGAETPEDCGDYFAWGETEPKTSYDWRTYKHCNGSNYAITKYCYNSSHGYNGFTDFLTILLPEDDAATTNWGSGWCMPTKEQWEELIQNTTQLWTAQNGVFGGVYVASNGNSIFLPAAGGCYYDYLEGFDEYGSYWSSSLYLRSTELACPFDFDSDGPGNMNGGESRAHGMLVRPVHKN